MRFRKRCSEMMLSFLLFLVMVDPSETQLLSFIKIQKLIDAQSNNLIQAMVDIELKLSDKFRFCYNATVGASSSVVIDSYSAPCGFMAKRSQDEVVYLQWTIFHNPVVWIEANVQICDIPYTFPNCKDAYVQLTGVEISGNPKLCGRRHPTKYFAIGNLKVSLKLLNSGCIRIFYQVIKPLGVIVVKNHAFSVPIAKHIEHNFQINLVNIPINIISRSYIRKTFLFTNNFNGYVLYLSIQRSNETLLQFYDGPGILSPRLNVSSTSTNINRIVLFQIYVIADTYSNLDSKTSIFYHFSFMHLYSRRVNGTHKLNLHNALFRIVNGEGTIRIKSRKSENVWTIVNLHSMSLSIKNFDFLGPTVDYTHTSATKCHYGGVFVILSSRSDRAFSLCKFNDGDISEFQNGHQWTRLIIIYYAGYSSGEVTIYFKPTEKKTLIISGQNCDINPCYYSSSIWIEDVHYFHGNELYDYNQFTFLLKSAADFLYIPEKADIIGKKGITITVGRLGVLSLGTIRIKLSISSRRKGKLCDSYINIYERHLDHSQNQMIQSNTTYKNEGSQVIETQIPNLTFATINVLVCDGINYPTHFSLDITKERVCGLIRFHEWIQSVDDVCKQLIVPYTEKYINLNFTGIKTLSVGLNDYCKVFSCVNIEIQAKSIMNHVKWTNPRLDVRNINITLQGLSRFQFKMSKKSICEVSEEDINKCALIIDLFDRNLDDVTISPGNIKITDDVAHINSGKEMVKLKSENLSWKEAKKECEEYGGHLPFLKMYHNDKLDASMPYFQYLMAQSFYSSTMEFGDLTYLGIFLKGKSFRWLDDSPVINKEWYVPDVHNIMPQSLLNQSSHWTSLTWKPTNDYLTKRLEHIQPIESMDMRCVGYIRNALERQWFTIDCNAKLNVKLVCSFSESKQISATMSNISLSIRCPKDYILLGNTCIKFHKTLESSTLREENCIMKSSLFEETSLSNDTKAEIAMIAQALDISIICTKIPISDLRTCKENEFMCFDQSCRPIAFKCNRIIDCITGEDEHFCPIKKSTLYTSLSHKCPNGFFPCEESEGCVKYMSVCDGIPNCDDHTDEKYCGKVSCLSHQRICSDGLLCVNLEHWCDGYQNCADASDEECKNDCGDFVCSNGKCLSWSKYNDGIPDCAFGEDETEYIKQVSSFHMDNIICKDNYHIPCGENAQCYHISQHCLYDIDYNGALLSCRLGNHLRNCTSFPCGNQYKCHHAYCIPFGYICNGRQDCPDGDDEMNCSNQKCPGAFRCKDQTCLRDEHLCDGRVHCNGSAEDELYCVNKILTTCESNHIKTPCATIVDGNFNFQTIMSFPLIRLIDLKNNSIKNLVASKENTRKSFAIVFDLSFNDLKLIPILYFKAFENLRYIYFQNNQISSIDTFAFTRLKLHLLDLSNNRLTVLKKQYFVETIIDILVLSGNDIFRVEKYFFLDLQITQRLSPSDASQCCMLKGTRPLKCQHGSLSFTCSNIHPHLALELMGWCTGGVAVLVNIFRIVNQIDVRKSKAIILKYLPIVDTVTGLYILLLSTMNQLYYDSFYYEKFEWGSSLYCQLLASASFASRQLSLFFLCTMAFQRYSVTAFPMKKHSLDRIIKNIVIGAWILSIFICSIPAGLQLSGLYTINPENRVCLWLGGHSEKIWSFLMYFVNIVLNFAMIVAIIICYVLIKKNVQSSGVHITCNQEIITRRNEKVFVNLICGLVAVIMAWTPLILIDVCSLFIDIGPITWSITSTLFISIGPCINPFFFIIRETENEKKKKMPIVYRLFKK